MFIQEYYFGSPAWMEYMRFIGGPALVFIGWYLYNSNERFGIGYGGFCLIYGLYYALKPVFWILFRLDSFKTTRLQITVTNEKLKLRDDISESEISLSGLPKIMKRKTYYVFQLTKFNKVYMPFSILTKEQTGLLDKCISV